MTRPANVDQWVVEGWMRPGTMGVFAATEGTGKSMARDEIAMRCSQGTGRIFDRFEVQRAVPVLLLDEDNGAEEEWRRNEAMLDHLGLERSVLTTYYRVSLAGVLLDDEAWQDRIIRWVDELSIGLLILDPVSMMYRAKELREELLPVANFLRGLIRRFPALVVLVIHHLRKPMAGQQTSERALSDLRGALWGQIADVVALLTPLGDRRVKLALHKRVAPTEVILEQTSAGPFVYVGDAGGAERRVSNDDRVIACIDAGASSAGDIALATGLRPRTVWNAIKRLRDAGILTANGALERAPEGLG